jgi:hypothetical protein
MSLGNKDLVEVSLSAKAVYIRGFGKVTHFEKKSTMFGDTISFTYSRESVKLFLMRSRETDTCELPGTQVERSDGNQLSDFNEEIRMSIARDPIEFMLDQLNRAAGWNRIGSEVQEQAVEIAVEIMNDENLDPGTRLKAVGALQASTVLGIKAIDSLTKLMEVRVLAGRVAELEAIVRESKLETLPELPGYDLPEVY